ncbi:MAG: hypothetical protein BWX72_01640 [Firmicutes bacterium ADurb.Bin080]|nr:MAG: hypothetical protein BWX72_01640 [Firmicutes bacterium ADurb.Bin080]
MRSFSESKNEQLKFFDGLRSYGLKMVEDLKINGMKKKLYIIGLLLLMLLITGGFAVASQGLDLIWKVFTGFLPIFKPIIEQSFKDYLTSAYFIVGIIIFIGSTAGIVFSVKERKVMYIVISAILYIISIVSMISNLAVCNI